MDIIQNSSEDIIISHEGFGILRKALIENLGFQKAKRFLTHFGFQLGVSKAQELMATKHDLRELLAEAPRVHASLKHVSRVEIFGSSSTFHNTEGTYDEVWGIWYDSFEAAIHLKDHGVSHECNCYSLIGLASGYLTTVHGREVFVYEECCLSKGDPYCTFRVKTREECERLNINLSVYDEAPIIEELELTYDRLYAHKSLLDKVTSYHAKLTDAILQQSDIMKILEIANESLGLPIYITNAHGDYLYAIDLCEEHLTILSKKTAYFKQLIGNSTASIKKLNLISAPIFLDNKIYATVSFIYVEKETTVDDFLFLERLSVVASLYFLNDRVRFETTERLKISFLDRLISGQYTNRDEILRHSQYIEPTLQAPYCIFSIRFQSQSDKPFDLYSQIFRLARLLKFYMVNGIISVKENHLIVLIYDLPKLTAMLHTMTTIVEELKKSLESVTLKIGISEYFQDIQHVDKYIKQAEQAMYFPRQKLITHHDELGLLGVFLGQIDFATLKSLASKELGELLLDDEKNKELLYTLYIFLKNNGKLEKTMNDLCLSIGGIKYRINKIEKILNKDLKNALASSYTLLLIEALVTLNEIYFDDIKI